MANRAYLYSLSKPPTSYSDRPDTICGLSEWAYGVPFSYRVLMSGNPRACASLISDGLEDDPKDKKTKLYAISGDFQVGASRLKKLVDVTRPLARESKELSAALKESLAFLKKHRDRYLHLETIELDLMTTTSEKALRASVDREIRACVKAGAAVDALASDTEKAAKQLAAAASRRAKAPLDAFYGLSLDDDFDSTRDKKTRYALGLSDWSDVLYFSLWNRKQFERAQRNKR